MSRAELIDGLAQAQQALAHACELGTVPAHEVQVALVHVGEVRQAAMARGEPSGSHDIDSCGAALSSAVHALSEAGAEPETGQALADLAGALSGLTVALSDPTTDPIRRLEIPVRPA